MEKSSCDHSCDVTFQKAVALFCKEAGNTKSGECKDVITAYLEKGKYIWFLNELQDSVSKTNGDAGAYAIPVSNQYDEKHTAECDASAPWKGEDFKIRSNKGERHCYGTENKLSCCEFFLF